MTDSDNSSARTPHGAEPPASGRVELLGKLIAAQIALERALAELVQSGGNTAALANQLLRVGELQAAIGTASEASLQAMRGDIAAAMSQSQSAAQEAREQVTAANAARVAAQVLSSAAISSRTALQHALSSLDHVPLSFASSEDEAEYRRREEERRAYIANQQGKHSPEGDLNAAGAGIGQMADAKAHGASGPEFEQRVNDLIATTEKLREAAKANGVSTEEFDRHLRDDLRRIMKSKGLSDGEIEARFAATPDPLEAAKAYLSSDDDLAQMRQSAKAINVELSGTPRAESQAQALPTHTGLNEALAKFAGAGVVLAEHAASEDFAHGVSAQAISASLAGRLA